jgi:hypothetical protein
VFTRKEVCLLDDECTRELSVVLDGEELGSLPICTKEGLSVQVRHLHVLTREVGSAIVRACCSDDGSSRDASRDSEENESSDGGDGRHCDR